jgi:hypothetical protein
MCSPFAAADFAIDACAQQARGDWHAQKQMIDAQANLYVCKPG